MDHKFHASDQMFIEMSRGTSAFCAKSRAFYTESACEHTVYEYRGGTLEEEEEDRYSRRCLIMCSMPSGGETGTQVR